MALGDGNLSCANGRATRLRITCDIKYPILIDEIKAALIEIFPTNRVSVVSRKRESCINISVYSNKLHYFIPWFVGHGTKIDQQAQVPTWILQDTEFSQACLKGLLQTDGSIYMDRKYLMVNFTNLIKPLATDFFNMIDALGFKPKLYQSKQKNGNTKFVIRLSRDTQKFIDTLNLSKK